MTATTEVKPWDFSHVLDLVNSLSHKSPSGLNYSNEDKHTTNDNDDEEEVDEDASSIDRKDFGQTSPSLGDFSKLWQYLGSPPEPQALSPLHPTIEGDAPAFASKTDYASDGATYVKTPAARGHAVHWMDQGSSGEQTGTVSDCSVVPETPTLTKTQRKKRNRKARKAQEAALAAAQASKKGVTSESEADDVLRKTPARKASSHVIHTPETKNYNLRKRDTSGKAITSLESDSLLAAASTAAAKVNAAKKANAASFKAQSNEPLSKIPNGDQPTARSRVNDMLASLPKNRQASASNATHSNAASQAPVVTPRANAPQFLPASVQPSSNWTSQPISYHEQLVNYNTVPRKRPQTIEPMTVRSGEDRHWALLMKLIGDFYEDRKHLISPMNLTTHNNDPNGIHVFVDASNIFIGFNDQLKRSRGIPHWHSVPSVDVSFDAFALLMERRRPVAKRVLVGSTPHVPAFDKAKAVGYECSILEKVYKARELTDRQIYFKELDAARNKRAKAPPANNVATLNGGGTGNGNGSGSETNAPQYAPARMIEQGVDEILHLKILESVVDTDTPGTIVLATGDAAQAEYSQGFMAMAERALKKGWTVELVSWSQNISAMYTRSEWTRAWGGRFRIVYLDDYAEELLDM